MFFKNKELGEAKPSLDQTLENIRSTIQFLESNENKLANFLKKNGF